MTGEFEISVPVAMFWLSTTPPSKSTKSTVTVEPGLTEIARGVAPAFCTHSEELALELLSESVTHTKPPTLVPESTTIVPEKTPLASMEPDPCAPVVGAALSCGLSLMVQVVQLLWNPPPVTVTVVPLAAVDGEKLTKLVIEYSSLSTFTASSSPSRTASTRLRRRWRATSSPSRSWSVSTPPSG